MLRHRRPTDEPLVPQLRGVFHQYAFVAAVAAGAILVALADGTRERLAVWVYATALAAMLGASALYHRFPWRTAAARLRARRIDHAMIFVFIAGTYTPFALLAFEGALGVIVLVTVWVGALLGVVVELYWIHAPRWVSAVAYLAVGWVGVMAVPELFSTLGTGVAVLVVGGAVLYTLGAVAYATSWPNPFPSTFGFHEVFHVLVVAAAVMQFVAVSLLVL
ncbi:MAG TPA: hemolysin III family protein [Gaiellaceae bacterium]|nr:hemolysin III family protein [Gaiellaceae bacterium]